MADNKPTGDLTLNKQLVTSVCELIDFYSKKGVFKINEYKDIATINERLEQISTALGDNSKYEELSAQEIGFILLIFKEGTTRIPTSIDNFGQLWGIYKHYMGIFEQIVEKEKKAEEDSKVPSVEELNSK
jgi:Sec-independent protein translocase protein TatA